MRRTLKPLLSQPPALALDAAAANKSPAISTKTPAEKIASTPTTKVANAQIENASRLRTTQYEGRRDANKSNEKKTILPKEPTARSDRLLASG